MELGAVPNAENYVATLDIVKPSEGANAGQMVVTDSIGVITAKYTKKLKYL